MPKALKINTCHYLFHGSVALFDSFDLSMAKPFKDFGKGMYLTTNIHQAIAWARNKSYVEQTTTAYIYCFEISNVDSDEINVLELLDFNKDWLDFICASRIDNYENDYDIIYDRVADSRAKNLADLLLKYKENDISAEQVIKEIVPSSSKDDQYCFKSDKALSLLVKKKLLVQHRDKKGNWHYEN